MASASRESGLALLMVLWGILILAAMSAVLVRVSRGNIDEARTAAALLRADAAADAGVAVAINRLITNDTETLTTDGRSAFMLNEDAVRVTIQDQAGLIDASSAPLLIITEVLRDILDQPDGAGRVAEEIDRFRTLGTAPVFDLLGQPRLQSLSELRGIEDITADVVSRIEQVLGLGSPGGLDPAVAPDRVLALHGLQRDTIARIAGSQDPVERRSLAVQAGLDEAAIMRTRREVYRITSEVVGGDARVRRSVLVRIRPTGDGALFGYAILDWR